MLHALGALHEQLRPDARIADPTCWNMYRNSVDAGGGDPIILSRYDADSIMNYCRDIYSEPTRLSAKDVEGLKALAQRTVEKMNGR